MATTLAFLISNRIDDLEVHCGTQLERFAERTIETGIVELRGHSSPSLIAASSSAQYALAPGQATTTPARPFRPEELQISLIRTRKCLGA